MYFSGLKVADITHHARISALEENVDELQNGRSSFLKTQNSF